jgi:hypothetical protein
MSIAGQLILLHVVILVMIAFCVATIRSRRFDDLTYDARMNSLLRRFLMPGKLADREVWRKQQKAISWFGLILSAVIYVLAMIRILHDHSS